MIKLIMDILFPVTVFGCYKCPHLFCVLTSGHMTISTQRGTGCGGPEVKTQKCMHKYYPDMYLILYCMTCFIVLYLIYVIYYACLFEKLLRAYVDCYKMYRL